jgi:hypothetical protein
MESVPLVLVEIQRQIEPVIRTLSHSQGVGVEHQQTRAFSAIQPVRVVSVEKVTR